MDFRFIEIFKRDISKYNLKNQDIKTKFEHSVRVMQRAGQLALQKGLSKEDVSLISLAALLHDYGRFAQHKQLGFFSDQEGTDHGNLGIDLLFHQKKISIYTNRLDDYDEIYDAVKYHNKYRLPSFMSKHNELICRIIRDADKMDQLYMVSTGLLTIQEDGSTISPKVKEAFEAKKTVSFYDIQNDNDRVIQLLAFLYDINYKETFQYLKENKIIENMESKIKDQERFSCYFEKAKKYIEEKVK